MNGARLRCSLFMTASRRAEKKARSARVLTLLRRRREVTNNEVKRFRHSASRRFAGQDG